MFPESRFAASVLLAGFLCACADPAGAGTFYVDGSRPDDGGDGTSRATAKKYISSGIGRMAGGDTLIVADGTYTGSANRILNVPGGSPGSPSCIRAEHDWGVTLSAPGGTPCQIDNSYIDLRGVKFKDYLGNKCVVYGNYVRVIRCASDGAGGNAASFSAAGTNDLFEECYSWGIGRYPMRVSSASGQYIVFRRCVVRWDYSNTDGPQACFANYDRPNVYFQNCIAIDGKDIRGQDVTYDGLKGFFTPNGANQTEFDGCISLNLEGAGFWIEDSPVRDVALRHCVAWDCKEAGQSGLDGYPAYLLYVRADETGGPLTVDHGTFGVSDLGRGLQIRQMLPNDVFKNSIVYGVQLNAGEYALSSGLTLEDYNCFYGNTGGRNVSGGVGSHSLTQINPLANSLSYLVRVETSSDLAGQADDGGDVGASIVKRVGISGTFYGEPGWNTVTDEDLWPFPNEDEMRADMKAFVMAPGQAFPNSPAMSGDRGFCADGQTLTRYIWEYLGHSMPADIYGISGPPVLFFSDLTSGPNTGGQDNQGAFVTVWGKNFGNTRRDSAITVGGGAVAGYPVWTNTKISFQLGTNAGTGNIVLRTAEGVSSIGPFTVRTGAIHFAATNGSDTTGNGSWTNPWRTIVKAKNMLASGDIAYVGDGIVQDTMDSYNACVNLNSHGTETNPKALIAYPGATVRVGTNSMSIDRAFHNWVSSGVGGYAGKYWVISQFHITSRSIGVPLAEGYRIVGNYFEAPTANGQVGIIEGRENHIKILGNTFYNVGLTNGTKLYHVIYVSGLRRSTPPRAPTEYD
ncbi:MAG: hypothetical protein V1929_01805, partial [bacterium]